MSDVSIRALPPVGMISLRGDMAVLAPTVTTVTGCAGPERRMSTRSGDVTAMWMSPDEMLLVCDYDAAAETAARLTTDLGDAFATVAIVSDARQVFDVDGDGAVDVLAKLMPVDFGTLGATEVRRTRMAQIPAAIWRHSSGFHLICFRSVADYAKDLLENARPIGG